MAVQKSKNTKRFYKNINNLYYYKLNFKNCKYNLKKSNFTWTARTSKNLLNIFK